MHALLFSGGTLRWMKRMQPQPHDWVVGIDAGNAFLLEHGLRPTIAVGDFDTLPSQTLLQLQQMGVVVQRHPAEKDATDTELALDLALAQGYKEIWLFGGWGSRWDHSLANLYLLEKARRRGARLVLWSPKNCAFLAEVGFQQIPKTPAPYLSLVPLDQEVRGITLEGVRYPLTDAVLIRGEGRGISNEILAEKATLRVGSGTLLLCLSSDTPAFEG
ncbi:MAG: thiamine diphosphokinase [Firmicutes bacterium]|nr:thiamine diphosphokinase [Bacillota bacterium]